MKRFLALELTICTAIATVGALPAQAVRSERVQEVLTYLASDRLAGRDSPSPGLEEAAQYLAWTFAKAGLEPGARVGDAPDWFHRYALPGVQFDTDSAAMTVTVDGARRTLAPGADFRIWVAGRAYAAEGIPLEPEAEDGPEGARGRRRMAGRNAEFVRVPAEDAAWRAASGGRQVIRRRAAGGAPVVLVRADAVPARGATVELVVPAPRDVEVPLRNVVGVLRGTDLAEEYVLVSAHYDHVGVRPRADGGDGVFNGADDDATGTTAVAVLAEHFGARVARTRRSLAFVCFSAEEKGLRGSRAFCESPPIPLERIAAVINIEMIGRPERLEPKGAWITGAALSDFASIAEPALRRSGVALVDFPMAPGLFFASDNLPFAQNGVVAHSISAGTLHEDYHRPGDEVDRIDVAHMTAVIQGLAAVVEELANRDERPRFTDPAREQLQRGR